MPRKVNGFGNIKSFTGKTVKGFDAKIDKGIGPRAAGSYPSNRQYGSSVQRTIIERYDLESDWVRWRKGYEYYAKASFERLRLRAPLVGSPECGTAQSSDPHAVCYDPGLPIDQDPDSPTYNPEYILTELHSKLYQGTDYEVDITFTGWRFATMHADSNNHYVMKRVTTSDTELFKVTKVYNSLTADKEAKANQELWVQGDVGPDGFLLLHMIGERLTDGETEATLSYILNSKAQPSIYMGQSLPEDKMRVKVSVPLSEIQACPYVIANGGNINSLVGEIGYIKDFFVEKDIALVDTIDFTDQSYTFTVRVQDDIPSPQEFSILDNTTDLPPSIYDIGELENIFTTADASYEVSGTFIYNKDLYQKFFGDDYLTAQLVEQDITQVSYSVQPFVINDLLVVGDTVEFSTAPFIGSFNLYSLLNPNLPNEPSQGYLVFSDYSFTNTAVDSYNGVYNHPLGPYDTVEEQIAANNKWSDEVWYRVINDVDPWQDEVFILQDVFLKPATTYSCSCPNYANAILRAPQATENEGKRKINRQYRYPLPTAQGKTDLDSIGLDSAAGAISSWENRKDRMSYKLCKHTVAAMFEDHLKLQEPTTYQTIDARLEFEKKLVTDIKETGEEFKESFERGGITTIEIVFALAQGLNLDDVEIAYVVLNTKS